MAEDNMHTGRCYWTNRTGRVYNSLFKKSYDESGKVKSCYAFNLKNRSEKATNIVQLVFDSEKPNAEPPERRFIPPERMQAPPENEPPERKLVPPERKSVLGTPEFVPLLSRQTSPKEDLSVDTFLNVSQISKHFSIANALYSGFQIMEALNKRCWASLYAQRFYKLARRWREKIRDHTKN